MTKEERIKFLEKHPPTCEEVERYIRKWDELEDYVNQEKALDKLFMQICKENQCIEDILIKCSALNDFYSTNIFKVHHVAQHYLKHNIDQRLETGDLTLVEDLTTIPINGKVHRFYSFATKYCSHHRPDIYPIYDSYVHKLLMYFREKGYVKFKTENDLKDYQKYTDIIKSLKKKDKQLDKFTVKEIDKYLWQLGKEAFNPY